MRRSGAAVLRSLRVCVAALLVGMPWQWAQATCGEGAQVQRIVGAGDLTLAYATQPSAIRVGQHFALDIWLCASSGGNTPHQLTRVDADMPAHRHGMNYRVVLAQSAPQQWRASGLMFHMPGRWRLQFDVSTNTEKSTGPQRLEQLLDVE
jgi:hypothetical protein